MDACETVMVVRPDHPDGFTTINKSDMTDADKEYKPKAEKPAGKKEDKKAK